MSTPDIDTPYGFDWGVVHVTRLAEIRDVKILGIRTPHRMVQISVSPTGRSVRVWIDGKEVL